MALFQYFLNIKMTVTIWEKLSSKRSKIAKYVEKVSGGFVIYYFMFIIKIYPLYKKIPLSQSCFKGPQLTIPIILILHCKGSIVRNKENMPKREILRNCKTTWVSSSKRVYHMVKDFWTRPMPSGVDYTMKITRVVLQPTICGFAKRLFTQIEGNCGYEYVILNWFLSYLPFRKCSSRINLGIYVFNSYFKILNLLMPSNLRIGWNFEFIWKQV